MRNKLQLCLVALSVGLSATVTLAEPAAPDRSGIYSKKNLVAWCIVPFDAKKRGPQERAAMLQRLGILKLAYDYRAEHIPTFDAEIEALQKHGIELTAWWFPTTLDDEAKHILSVLKRHKVRTQLWVTGSGGPESAEQQQAWIEREVARIRPIAEAAAEIGCKVGLYNHGGWFGEPENQIAILKELDCGNVGIVYNLHHGHAHLDHFGELLQKMKPYLYALNLNGMTQQGDKKGKKILPIGAGNLDASLLRTIRESGYKGPIGILNHTEHDAEARLRDNLEGLDWLLDQLDGQPAGIKPKYRTFSPPRPADQDSTTTTKSSAVAPPYDAQLVADTVAAARDHGVAERGAAVFAATEFACLPCHKIGKHGGTVGPDLTAIGKDRTAEQIVESLFWPKREVKPEYVSVSIVTVGGKLHSGYKLESDDQTIVLRDPAAGQTLQIARADIEEEMPGGTLMPDGLMTAMSRQQQLDLIRFLTGLGRSDSLSPKVVKAVLAHAHVHAPAAFPYDRKPLHPEQRPSWQHPINRDRVYDYYAKQAEYFRMQEHPAILLPEFPGLDGGQFGHWGNQTEETWASDRWNDTQLGSVQCGIFQSAGLTVARGVCLRLGKQGELSACFNPDNLQYEAVWTEGFVKFSSFRHGFLDGLTLDGTPLPRPETKPLTEPFEYRGFYRHGKRVLFAYRIGDTEYLDAPWVEDGKFTRTVAPASEHPLKHLIAGGPPQWPQRYTTRIVPRTGRPYAIDTIELPSKNRWNALIFCGDHDFLPDGSALVCTMQGDVWQVRGLTADRPRTTGEQGTAEWRRFASGLHHALGLVVADDGIYVQGRDQITRLHDLNNDGEADFYECFSNAFSTSAAGHDFISGLQRDEAGRFYITSGNQGLLRISADGKRAEVIATGFRNPDGLGLYPDGTVTVPCSEGKWTPASMICAVRPSSSDRPAASKPAIGGHTPPSFGYEGPRDGRAPDLPLVYLPRGLDNSSGGQAYVASDRWGPLFGQMLHFSFGTGS